MLPFLRLHGQKKKYSFYLCSLRGLWGFFKLLKVVRLIHLYAGTVPVEKQRKTRLCHLLLVCIPVLTTTLYSSGMLQLLIKKLCSNLPLWTLTQSSFFLRFTQNALQIILAKNLGGEGGKGGISSCVIRSRQGRTINWVIIR